MKFRSLLYGLAGASAATLAYGAGVGAKRLVLERSVLRLPLWPERMDGFTIAVLADFHLGSRASLQLAQRAVAMAIDAEPDMVVLPGDLVTSWHPDLMGMLGEVLEPLLVMNGRVCVVPGNHEYKGGSPELLRPICNALDIRVLRNEAWSCAGVTWVGVDSDNAKRADPEKAMASVDPASTEPVVALWHEPDGVGRLPAGAALMISGHSHGGQFTFPWGWTPMHTRNGEIYVRGFYPEAPTPVYVSRGVGTTFFPARLGCPPEVSLLRLIRAGW